MVSSRYRETCWQPFHLLAGSGSRVVAGFQRERLHYPKELKESCVLLSGGAGSRHRRESGRQDLDRHSLWRVSRLFGEPGRRGAGGAVRPTSCFRCVRWFGLAKLTESRFSHGFYHVQLRCSGRKQICQSLGEQSVMCFEVGLRNAVVQLIFVFSLS